MKFHLDTANIFVPDGLPVDQALARTTHLCIGAHQDDLEIMAPGAILECFQSQEKWFTGVVVTDGRGSPRHGIYEKHTDDEMRLVRFAEQRKAATVGEYASQVILDYPSSVLKKGISETPVTDIASILLATRPQVVFTHNLADKHDTHVAVALKVIAAIRGLPESNQPGKLYGCEVWRGLDWMVDSDKVTFDVSNQENLQAALLGVYDSQISGGKRYDLATLARQRANATFFEPNDVDNATALNFTMDMTPLLTEPDTSPADFVLAYIRRFELEVSNRLKRLD